MISEDYVTGVIMQKISFEIRIQYISIENSYLK